MTLARRLLMAAGGGGSIEQPFWIPTATLLGHLGAGFTKAPGNPVLPRGTGGAWDDWGVRELAPVVDTNGLMVTEPDGIWAYYGGFPDNTGNGCGIGLAKSTDGGATWVKHGGNPVVTASGSGWYQNTVFQPAPVKLGDGTRVMLAAGRTGAGADGIGCLTSADGITWSDAGSKLTLGSFHDGATAISELGVPSMIRRSAGDWLMLCEGLTTGIANGWRIYGATASDPTATWTVLNSGQPLLSPTGVGWESAGVANPHVIENEPGSYFLMYNGTPSSQFWQVGFAYGSSLTALTRYAGNPLISKGTAGAWDDLEAESCFLPKEPWASSLRVWYQGYRVSDGSMAVGLATAT